MKTLVKIQLHTVGQCFGHEAIVRAIKSRRRLHTTRVVPYGYHHSAYVLATDWAESRGYEVSHENEDGGER
jgi:hypothetical protein